MNNDFIESRFCAHGIPWRYACEDCGREDEANLDQQIDKLHGPGAAAALDAAISDGSIFADNHLDTGQVMEAMLTMRDRKDSVPAPDWLVPADTMKALREAERNVEATRTDDDRADWYSAIHALTDAARRVVDAATEVER